MDTHIQLQIGISDRNLIEILGLGVIVRDEARN